MRKQVGLAFCDDHVSACGNHCVGWKRKVDPIDKSPSGQIDGIGSSVVKLHVLIAAVSRNGCIHQLVNDNVSRFETSVAIASARSGICQFPECFGTVGQAADRDGVGLSIKSHRIEHTSLVGVDKENAIACGFEGEFHLILVE